MVRPRRIKRVGIVSSSDTPYARIMCMPRARLEIWIEPQPPVGWLATAHAILMHRAVSITDIKPRAVGRERNALHFIQMIRSDLPLRSLHVPQHDAVIG